MLAIINFKNPGRISWLKKIKYYIAPNINKLQIAENEFITLKSYYFEVIMPDGSSGCRKRALKKLKKQMEAEGCQYFIAAKGEWTEYLTDHGFKTGNYQKYLMKLIPNAIRRICGTSGLTPDKLSICLHDPKIEECSGEILYQLTKLCKNLVYITSRPEMVEEFMQSLFEETGAAVVATADYSKTSGIGIVVSLSQTEKLFKEGAISMGALIITADKDYIPNMNMPNTVINAFGLNIPQSLLNLLPDGMRAWEFIGNLHAITLNKLLLQFNIYNFYSYGKTISEKSICEGIMGLDKNRSI